MRALQAWRLAGLPAKALKASPTQPIVTVWRAHCVSAPAFGLLSQQTRLMAPTLSSPFLPSRKFHASAVRPSSADDITNKAAEAIAEPVSGMLDTLTQTVAAMGDAASHAVVQKGDIVAAGLGCWYTPVGLLQRVLEFGCTSMDLPWWASIAATTVAIRLCIFPVVIATMRNNVRLSNIKPEMDVYIEKMKKFQAKGDMVSSAKEMEKLRTFMAANNVSYGRLFMGPLVQLPIFISFFLAIRKMAELPIESMKTGGILWFTDLTLPDTTYALPIISAATLLTTIELGSEGFSNRDQGPQMKMMMRMLALTIIPFASHFPSGLFVYWITANVFSLSQLAVFKIPGVKARLDIPELKEHPKPNAEPIGFMDSFKTSLAANDRRLEEQNNKRPVNYKLGKGTAGKRRKP